MLVSLNLVILVCIAALPARSCYFALILVINMQSLRRLQRPRS